MKILWLGHNLAYPPNRGVLQRNYNLLRQAAKSCEVHVLAFDQPASRPVEVTPADCVEVLKEFCGGVSWLRLENKYLRGNRYCLAARGLLSREPYDFHWLRSTEMAEKLRKLLERVPFDVVHFDTIGLAQYRWLVENCGTVLNHHNIESSMMGRRATNEANPLRRAYWYSQADKLRKAELRWCSRFHVNLVVSEQDRRDLSAAIPTITTAVVANGTDVEFFKMRPDPGGTTLLFCGGLDWYPNIDAIRFFFDAIWPKLVDEQSDVEVYIVGRNPPEWLAKLSAKDCRIHVTGFVEDVRPYFEKATAYVCPIVDGGGTRLKVLDALAMGVPLVGTSFACSGLPVEDGEHVLMADAPKTFVTQIQRLFNDPALRRKLSGKARAFVERLYSWEVVGKSLIDAYDVAVARSPRRIINDR